MNARISPANLSVLQLNSLPSYIHITHPTGRRQKKSHFRVRSDASERPQVRAALEPRHREDRGQAERERAYTYRGAPRPRPRAVSPLDFNEPSAARPVILSVSPPDVFSPGRGTSSLSPFRAGAEINRLSRRPRLLTTPGGGASSSCFPFRGVVRALSPRVDGLRKWFYSCAWIFWLGSVAGARVLRFWWRWYVGAT